jgi:hypothetical protein
LGPRGRDQHAARDAAMIMGQKAHYRVPNDPLSFKISF